MTETDELPEKNFPPRIVRHYNPKLLKLTYVVVTSKWFKKGTIWFCVKHNPLVLPIECVTPMDYF